jgi:ribosomal protein S18 acetylase RimI-like enzyme
VAERPSLRPAAPDDLAFLIELRVRTMTPHLAAAGEPVTLEEHRARVLHDFAHIRLILRDGRAIGMVKLVASDDCRRLVQLQVAPEEQGRGIGTEVLREVLDDARRARVPVVLSVLRRNPARRLYERLGFRVVAQKSGSYEMRADP